MNQNLTQKEEISKQNSNDQNDEICREHFIHESFSQKQKGSNVELHNVLAGQPVNRLNQDTYEYQPKIQFVYNEFANYSQYYKNFCRFEWPQQAALYKYSQIRNPIGHQERSNISYLKMILDESRKQCGIYMRGVRFRPFLNNSKTYYTIKCYVTKDMPYHCPWKLIYQYDQKKSIYSLKSYNIIHEHPLYNNYRIKKIKQKFNSKKEAYEHIKNMTNNFEDCSKDIKFKSIGAIKEFYQEKISMVESLRKCLKQFKKSAKLRKYVLEEEHQHQLHDGSKKIEKSEINKNKNDKQQVFVLTNSIMKLLYRAYNKVLFIDREFVFQNQRHQEPKYSLFIFSGIGHAAQTVYFAIGIMRTETTQKLKEMLTIFFNIVQQFPQTLSVKVVEKNLIQAFEETILRKHPQINFFKRQASSEIFQGLQTTNTTVESQICEIQKRTHNSQRKKFCKWTLYELFTSHSKYSYEKYRGPFIGFKLPSGKVYTSFSQLQKLKRRYQEFPNIICFRAILRKIVAIMIKENNSYSEHKICKLPIQEFYNKVKDLKKIRSVLETKPFNKFIKNLQEAHKLSIIFCEPPHFFVVQDQFMPSIVSLSQKIHPLYNCQCQYYQKSGLPCKHIIKVAVTNSDSLLNCIDLFWIVNFAIIGLDIIPKTKTNSRKSMEILSQSRGRERFKIFSLNANELHSKKIEQSLYCFQSINLNIF